MVESTMRLRIPELLLVLLAVNLASAQLCYNPNGSISNDRPCDPNADVSVCCEDGFVCTANKLCQPAGWYDGSTGNQLQLIRSTCTDKTWKSGKCPDHCIAESPTGGEWVMRCGAQSSKYCCSDDNCCSNGGKRYDLGDATKTAIAGRAATTTTETSTSTPTSTTTTMTTTTTSNSTTTSPTASPTTTPGDPTATASEPSETGSTNSNSKAIGIGVGVGVGVGVLILGGLGFFLWRQKRARDVEAARNTPSVSFVPPHMRNPSSQLPEELDSHDPRVFPELEAKDNRAVYEVE